MNHKYEKYFNKKAITDCWIPHKKPQKNKYDFIISIPSYCEFDYLFKTLDTINNQDRTLLDKSIVSIIINNSSCEVSKDIINNNYDTYKKLINSNYNFEFIAIDAFSKNNAIDNKKAGVGIARKISIDIILKYMNLDTVICFLDADTQIPENYLYQINKSQLEHNWASAVVDFHHLDDEVKTRELIYKYESFLKDTARSLKKAGSPYSFVPLGCTMLSRLDAYIGVGGMNVRKAAEDFYFLQELKKCYDVHYIDNIQVRPSARHINRSYLGTSKRMFDALNHNLNIKDLYFSKEKYKIIEIFLRLILNSKDLNADLILSKTKAINQKMYLFLKKHRFESVWPSIQSSKSYNQFENQFHKWFDFLKTIKLLKYI